MDHPFRRISASKNMVGFQNNWDTIYQINHGNNIVRPFWAGLSNIPYYQKMITFLE
jgi:hypothetical protein